MNLPASATPSPGTREFNKKRTRDTLVRAALDLFLRHGYDETTVDEIAAVADVSQRTFFRYFDSKEDVALSFQEALERQLIQALRARPAEEPPLTALRQASLVTWENLERLFAEVATYELCMGMPRLVDSSPGLLGAHLRRAIVLEEKLALEIARREGVDPDLDLRPRVLVAAVCGAMRVVNRVWSRQHPEDLWALRALTLVHLEQLSTALHSDWLPAPLPTRTPEKWD
ncbi:TetR family transcriptional regulator [Streptomyces sp. NPDC102437]|uniref:TetR family transcriptional regulator n=1 Tax=Streptomyces sp. NPDC102437 TaxID=3366175 RepID=UPI00382324F3